jgi:hypothetical protein
MSRSGYSEDCENLELWRGAVDRAIHGKRGQAFLREMAAALDAMPTKELIRGELINEQGACCAIGAVCKARGTDVSQVDYYDADSVANAVGIARAMAAEIEFENDDDFCGSRETNADRWTRMRKWVASNLAVI